MPRNLLKATAAQQGEKISAVRSRVGGSLDAAGSWVVELEQEAEKKADEAVKATGVYVREHPWQTVAIAAAVGFVFGSLARRSSAPRGSGSRAVDSGRSSGAHAPSIACSSGPDRLRPSAVSETFLRSMFNINL